MADRTRVTNTPQHDHDNWVLGEIRHLVEHHDVERAWPWFVADESGERPTKTVPDRVDYVAYGVRDPRIVFVVSGGV